MKRKTVAVGSYGTNCTILEGPDGTWIVDPGGDCERIERELGGFGAEVSRILLTHAHFDHIGAVSALLRRHPGATLCLHPADRAVYAHPFNAFPPEYPHAELPKGAADCREVHGMTTIETPGHTPGGVCYYFPGDSLLLSGDTLFAGSVGRTDLPGGSMTTLMASLEKLKTLPGDTEVIPGHGAFTTIAAELAVNPFLA